MNTTFNKRRFLQLLKWDTMTSKKQYIRQTIITAILLSILFCCQLFWRLGDVNEFSSDIEDLKSFQGTNILFIIFIVSAYMTFMASSVFRNMSTKQQRISFLILPASNIEKFLVRILHTIVGFFVCFVVALAVADLLQFLLSLIVFHGNGGSLILLLASNLYNSLGASGGEYNYLLFGPIRWLDLSVIFTLYALEHSFWIFCGTLFRRHPLLFTLCAQFVLSMVIGTITMPFLFGFADFFVYTLNATAKEVLFFTGCWLVIVLMYIGAYRVFRKTQAINNKWVNL